MKVTWEAVDIRPGRKVQKPGCGISGLFMVGYRYAVERDDCGQIYGVVSMADGQFIQLSDGSKKQVAQHMNDAGYYMPVELL